MAFRLRIRTIALILSCFCLIIACWRYLYWQLYSEFSVREEQIDLCLDPAEVFVTSHTDFMDHPSLPGLLKTSVKLQKQLQLDRSDPSAHVNDKLTQHNEYKSMNGLEILLLHRHQPHELCIAHTSAQRDKWISCRNVASNGDENIAPMIVLATAQYCVNSSISIPPRRGIMTVYQLYENISLCLQSLRSQYNGSIVAYAPILSAPYKDSKSISTAYTELLRLHRFLSLQHLVKDRFIPLAMPSNSLGYSRQSSPLYESQRTELFLAVIHQINRVSHMLRTRACAATESLHPEVSKRNRQWFKVNNHWLLLLNFQQRALQRRRIYHSTRNHEVFTTESLALHCEHFLMNRKYDPECHPAGALSHPILITGLGGSGTHAIANKLHSRGWRIVHEQLQLDGAVSWPYAVNDYTLRTTYPWGAIKRRSFLFPRFERVLHVIRSPLAQISSCTAHRNESYDFILHSLRYILPRESDYLRLVQIRKKQQNCSRGTMCHLHFASLSWLYWNKFVNSYADATYRIEDEDDAIRRELCKMYSTNVLSSKLLQNRKCPLMDCQEEMEASKVVVSRQGKESSWSCERERVQTAPRSTHHYNHQRYTFNNISSIDATLARQIAEIARDWGYLEL